jgi:uncharacterized coiled-coil protein SlyX
MNKITASALVVLLATSSVVFAETPPIAPRPATPVPTTPAAPAKAAAPAPAAKSPDKSKSKNVRVSDKCKGVDYPHSNLGLVAHKPIWEGRFDGDMPPAGLKCPVGSFAAIMGSVAKATDQQCFEYLRSESLTDPETWKTGGGIPVHAANVTPNIGKPRAWCVTAVITPEDFDSLSKFLNLLDGMNWEELAKLLKDAPNLARQDWVLAQIESQVKPLKEEITAIRTTLALLTKRVEKLEGDMKEVKSDVADLKKRKFSLDLGVAGYISPPMLGGTNMAYDALAKICLNFTFGENADWIFRPALGVGAGNDRVWGVALTFEASFLKILNTGSVNLGPMVRGSTNILLKGPTGSYASDSNAGAGALLRFYMGQSKRFYLEASGALGAKIQNCPCGGWWTLMTW